MDARTFIVRILAKPPHDASPAAIRVDNQFYLVTYQNAYPVQAHLSCKVSKLELSRRHPNPKKGIRKHLLYGAGCCAFFTYLHVKLHHPTKDW